LSDLTFAEDGNPDMLDRPPEGNKKIEYINFAKRDIICKIIFDVQLNQQEGYPFPVVEHVANFLHDLPCMEEKDLYGTKSILFGSYDL
jgi:hypothetical protein